MNGWDAYHLSSRGQRHLTAGLLPCQETQVQILSPLLSNTIQTLSLESRTEYGLFSVGKLWKWTPPHLSEGAPR